MLHKEYYATGEIKNEGTFLEIMDCTSRESGRNIESDDHKSCVECLDRPTFRKILFSVLFLFRVLLMVHVRLVL